MRKLKTVFYGIFGIALLILSQIASADVSTKILAIETNAYQGLAWVEVSSDNSGILQLLTYHSHDGKVLSFTLDQLKQRQVLKQMDGHDVVFISVENDFTAERGGHANVRYLRNGISGTYKNFRLNLEIQGKDIVLRSTPNPSDPESDSNASTSVFNYIFMEKNTFLGRTIGVDRVVPSVRQLKYFKVARRSLSLKK